VSLKTVRKSAKTYHKIMRIQIFPHPYAHKPEANAIPRIYKYLQNNCARYCVCTG